MRTAHKTSRRLFFAMERYNLSYEEASLWARHVYSIWTSLEAEYAVFGDSEGLRERIQILLPFPDQEIWFEHQGPDFLSSREFRDYIEGLRALS